MIHAIFTAVNERENNASYLRIDSEFEGRKIQKKIEKKKNDKEAIVNGGWKEKEVYLNDAGSFRLRDSGVGYE